MMYRFLLLVFLTFISIKSFAQNQDEVAADPRYRYIYSITKDQAWKISKKQYKDVFTDTFLKHAIDSLGAIEPIPNIYNKGGYISIFSKGKYINVDFLKSRSLYVDVITTPFEQGFIVEDALGKALSDVVFYTPKGMVRLTYNGYYYKIPKELYGKEIIVECKAEFVLVTIPAKRKVHVKSKKGYSDNDKKSFVLVDKPKYHIGDTVFVKGYLPRSLFKKEAQFSIYYSNKNYKRIVVKKENILKDGNGSYLYSFVIPDSLPIDKEYSISLLQKNNNAYCSFFIEDYYLDDFALQAEIDFGRPYQDSIQIDLRYTTSQGNPVDAGRLYLRLDPLEAYINQKTELYMPATFIQDTIQVGGAVKYIYKGKIPTLPNGEYELNLTVQGQSNGQVVEIQKKVEYKVLPVIVTHTVAESVFTFKAFNHGNFIQQGYALYGDAAPYDTVSITFPYDVDVEKQALPHSFCIYNVGSFPYESRSTEVFLAKTNNAPATNIHYSIKENKVFLYVENTFNLKLRITDDQKKQLCESKESLIMLELPLQKKHMLFCEYLFKGKYVQNTLLISPDFNALLINAELADTISPGQNYTGEVSVSRLKKNAVKNVNLTAFAIDSRLVNKYIPRQVDLFKYDYKEISSSIDGAAIVAPLKDSSIQKYIYYDYYDFLYHDSINYFLIPEYDTSLTEAFIYIEKNDQYVRPIYIFEDGLPVYWQGSDEESAQSFYTNPGYHSYEIRLYNKTIYADSIYVYASYKNNILIHIEGLSEKQLRVKGKPRHLKSEEIDRLYSYLYILTANKYTEHLVFTRSNSYRFSSKNNIYVLNPTSAFYTPFHSERPNIIKADTTSGKKYYTYLSKRHFINLKANESAISISELKKIEDKVFVPVRLSYITSARRFKLESNAESMKYAQLYVHQDLSTNSHIQLIDAKQNRISGIEIKYGLEKFALDSGNYQLQVLDSIGGVASEQKIVIDKPGHYIKSVYSATRLIKVEQDSLNKMYGNDFLEPRRLLSKRKTPLLNYVEILGGVNAAGFNSNTVHFGYQFGGMVGHQFMSSHYRIEVRGLYGKTALSDNSYQYQYAKLGVLGWASLFKLEKLFRRRPTINAYIGTGVYGQSVFTNGANTFGFVAPIGTAIQYKISYRFDLGLEAIWNAHVSGKDFTGGNGLFEMNFRLHINVNHHTYKVRSKSHHSYLLKGGVGYSSSNSKNNQTITTTNTITLSEVETYNAEPVKPITERVRSDFYDRAYWVPSFKTDAAGRAAFNARYPDALTQWDNYIIAVKGRRSNTWQSQTTTYLKDYVQLYVPRFAIKGDTLSASHHVHSNLLISVVNKVDGNIVNETVKGDSIFSFYAPQSIDTLTCSTYLFTNGKLIDGEQRTIPVFNAGNEVHAGTFTYLKGDTLLYIHKPDSVSEASVYLSGSMHDLVSLQYKHLMEYAYNCNEQTASKLIASIYEKEFISNYKGKHPQDFYLRLKKNLNNENMYGWWKYSKVNLSMTAYVYYALTLYYKNASLTPDKFYTDLTKALTEYTAKEKISFFTYWLMKESGLSMKSISIDQPQTFNRQQEILNLRIEQLEGRTIDRKEIMKHLDSTMLGNTALYRTSHSRFDWYDNDLLYLIILHKIAKANHPDIAADIRKGLIERGSLSINTPTYIKALFIDELIQISEVQQTVKAVTYDETSVPTLPFIKNISDTSTHILSIKDASGIYVVNNTTQIETKEVQYPDLNIDYLFKQDGMPVTALRSGYMAEQIITVKIEKTSSFVMLEIPIAAGCMVEGINASNPALLINKEVYRDKIILYFDTLPAGAYTFTVREKIVFKGNYQLNPCSINLMYFPMIQTQTALRRIVIE